MKNAEFYEKKGCCWIFDQRINKVKLTNFIINLLSDKTDLINKKNLQKLNNLNSWAHINQKLKGSN